MNEKYVCQIVKKLKCSKSRREEIRKQLMADLPSEAENGETLEEMIGRMGNPEEIAEEFNNSFSDSERKKYRKEKRMKRLTLIGILILALAALIYWALPKSTALESSKVFDKEEVQAKAEQVVYLLDTEDYETLYEESDEKMKSALTKSVIDEAKAAFGADWGAFQAFGNTYLAEVRQMGKRSAVVQVNVSYENVSVTYTISFDEDMNLSGLWMK